MIEREVKIAFEILKEKCKNINNENIKNIENNNCICKYVIKIKFPLDGIKVKNYFDRAYYQMLDDNSINCRGSDLSLHSLHEMVLEKYPIYEKEKYLPLLNKDDTTYEKPFPYRIRRHAACNPSEDYDDFDFDNSETF